jgi:hypothetical protein
MLARRASETTIVRDDAGQIGTEEFVGGLRSRNF